MTVVHTNTSERQILKLMNFCDFIEFSEILGKSAKCPTSQR